MGRHRGKVKISDAMLLYEAPTGMAIFSLDGRYLDRKVEDFWACIPQLSLKVFMKYGRVSTFIDVANKAIDDRLAKTLTMWCRFKNKLIVGSAEYQRIIEENLGITCQIVNPPEDEGVSGLENPIHTLLSEEKCEPTEKDHLPLGGVVMFLCQHGIDVKPDMVGKYESEAAQRLHRIELREKEHLKFLRILLKDFMVLSEIDTTKWSLIQFATVPKLICHPRASYQISHPVQIFSYDEYLKIETKAPQYKRSFSKIDALSVYNDVISLHTEKSILLWDLNSLVKKAKKVQDKAEVIRPCGYHSSGEPNKTDLPTTDSCHLEPTNSAEPKQQVIPNQTCIAEGRRCLVPGIPSTSEIATATTPGLLEYKQNGHTDLIVEKMNLLENRDTCVQSTGGDETIPASSYIPDSEQLKGERTDTGVKKNPPEVNGDDANNEKARDDTKVPASDAVQEQTENMDDFKENKQAGDAGDERKKLTASTPGLLETMQNGYTGAIEEKMNLPENRHKGVQSMNGDAKPASEGISATSGIVTASTPRLMETKQNGRTDTIKEKMNLPENIDTGVQSMHGDKANPATSDIPNSEQLKGQDTDTSVKKNPAEANGDYANYKARGDRKIPASGPKSGTSQDQRTGTSVAKPDVIPEITSDDEENERAREAIVPSTGGDKANPASSDKPNTEQLKGEDTDTSVKNNPPEANGDYANYKKARDETKVPASGELPKSGTSQDQRTGTTVTKPDVIPERTSDDEDERAREAGVPSTGANKATPASSDKPNSEQLKVQDTDTSVKKNPPEANGDYTNYDNARDDTKIPASGELPKSGMPQDQRTGTSVTKPDVIPETTVDDEEDERVREAGVPSMGGDKATPASSDKPNSEQFKGQDTDTSVKKNPPEANGDYANYDNARDDAKIPASGELPKSGMSQDQRTCTTVTETPVITSVVKEDSQANPASGEITQSRRLLDLLKEEREKSDKSVPSSGGIASRISKAMKQLRMVFICGQPVH